MGRILHSTNACDNTVNHIATDMRNTIFTKIVGAKCKISLIIYEPGTLSQKSTLIIYIRTYIPELDLSTPVNLFLGLVELENATAIVVFNVLLQRLHSVGISEE